jgi:hypothetical protein
MILEILLEDVSLNRRDDLEEIWILRNCFTSDFILKLVLGRRWERRSG